MLSEELKKSIQQYYSELVESLELQNRPGQKRMIADIANCLGSVEVDEDGLRVSDLPAICAIEAGTGVGKTIAYLLATIPFAQALGKKVVVATATVALQEQVVNKDIPDLLKNSSLKFTCSLAKGRGRYLCLSKLDNLLKSNSSQEAMMDLYGLELDDDDIQDTALYQEMLEALMDGRWQGDRDDWDNALEEVQWRRVAVESGQCMGNRCSNFSHCCFYKTRTNMLKADCIIANHDLVLADLSLGGGVFLPAPEDSIYIFDEAHHLPAKGVNHFAHSFRIKSTETWLDRLPVIFSRLAGEAGHKKNRKGHTSGDVPEIARLLEKATSSAARCLTELKDHAFLFEAFIDKSESMDPKKETSRYTFDCGQVNDEIKVGAQQLLMQFSELAEKLDSVNEELKDCLENEGGVLDRASAENWFQVLGSMKARADAAVMLWRGFAIEDYPQMAPNARWLTFSRFGNEQEIMLSVSPVLAAEALTENLWNDCFAAILTSATMTAMGNFEFLAMRTGLHEQTVYNRIFSPFDFTNAATVQIPHTGFNPSQASEHTDAIIEVLPELVKDNLGSLVLFSSRRQMQDVLTGLEEELKALVLCQDDYSKQVLITTHKDRIDRKETSIIFGLSSLTEGIDLPGEYCTHVIIAKIPFPVPNDPVDVTLGEWIKQKGKNPFTELSVPQAALRLIQGTGRLLRSESDSGKITILDERLVTRQYGKAILASLPPYTFGKLDY